MALRQSMVRKEKKKGLSSLQLNELQVRFLALNLNLYPKQEKVRNSPKENQINRGE